MMLHLRQRAQKLPPRPRPSEHVLDALIDRIERARADQGEPAALHLAVLALTAIDTAQQGDNAS